MVGELFNPEATYCANCFNAKLKRQKHSVKAGKFLYKVRCAKKHWTWAFGEKTIMYGQIRWLRPNIKQMTGIFAKDKCSDYISMGEEDREEFLDTLPFDNSDIEIFERLKEEARKCPTE